MTIFGYTLVKIDQVEKHIKLQRIMIRYHEVYRWFSGWKDLDIIWDYINSDHYFGGISECREKYAKARGTNVYGLKNQGQHSESEPGGE